MATFLDPDAMTMSEAYQITAGDDDAGFFSFLKREEKKSVILDLLPWYETSTGGELHQGTRAISAPKGDFRAINGPIASGHSASESYEERIKSYELKSEVDIDLIDIYGTPEQRRKIRDRNDKLNLIGFTMGLAEAIALNPGTDPKSCKGLLPRRASLDSKYVIDAGGKDGALGSILLMRPAEDGVNLRYNSGMGKDAILSLQDLGKHPVPSYDTNGNNLGNHYAYVSLLRANYGIDIADNDALIRICNIPTDKALTEDILDIVIDIVSGLPQQGQGYIALMPAKIRAQYWKFLKNKNNVYYTSREIEGMGSPLHLLNVPLFDEGYMSANEEKVV